MTLTLLDEQKGKVDRSALLGRLMWYTVPEATMLDFATVVSELTARGLARALPSHPEDHNLFRRASKSAERRKIPHNGSNNQFENWMIRDVASGNAQIITRRIVVEIVDPAGRRLSYEQVADIEFERPVHIPDRSQEFADKIAEIDARIAALGPRAHSRRAQLHEHRLNVMKRRDACPTPMSKPSKLHFVWLRDETTGVPYSELTHPTAKEIMADVSVNFARWRGKLNDQAVREWIRRSILAMGATPVRPSGGVYFLEERHADQVEALEKFCADLLPKGGECHSVEIPDNDKQREMVKRAIENETVGEIERMMAEVAKIRKEGFLTDKAHLDMLSQVRILESKMSGYTKLLEKDLSAVQTRLKLLDAQTKALGPLKGKKRRKAS